MSAKDSKSLNETEVQSKYFSNSTGMDESLSEFQEKKKSCSGPKTTKVKQKKPIKKIKGQKDIRTVLKKNELVAYANDFDKICKQSGLDVDSEQLQLAIALSKSLQESENSNEETPLCSKALSSQQRIGKIRTTLQEYGFKVPEIKVPQLKSKKGKRRKNYKLLLTTEIEKQQIIYDRYSQILVQNLDCSTVIEFDVNTISPIFKLASSITYEELRDFTFYVEDLVEKSPNTVGSLLRDWSLIPGRPASPKIKHSEVVFSEINCNQEEFDCVLSGSLKKAKELVKDKYFAIERTDSNSLERKKQNDLLKEEINTEIMDGKVIEIDDYEEQSNNIQFNTQKPLKEPYVDLTQNYDPKISLTVNTDLPRSHSPDIFEDEMLTGMDSPEQIVSQEQHTEHTNVNTEIMDLTECVHITSQKHNAEDSIKTGSQLSQNKTTRKSNDLMELTNVVGSSQPCRLNTIEENVDLTQSSDSKSGVEENTNIKDNHIEMDLTQSSDSSIDLPFIPISGTQSLDETVILSEEAYHVEGQPNTIEAQSKNTITPKTSISNKNEDHPDSIHSITLNSSNDTIDKETIQSPDSPIKDCKSKSQSFFEEFIHSHSDDESGKNAEELTGINNVRKDNNEGIDLTQSSNDSLVLDSHVETEAPKISFDNSSLGKKDNVSIDYDQVFDDIVSKSPSISKASASSTSVFYDIVDEVQESTEKSKENDLSSSQTSEVFEISDKELDYSIHKSRLEFETPCGNFEFGGISLVDDLPGKSIRQSRDYNESRYTNDHLDNESFFPNIDMGVSRENINKENEPNKEPCGTPSSMSLIKNLDKIVNTQTPSNGGYIIKTDQITPMLNYESMTTPERNRELDKYGLKPFKRKRAIQMLTHLYNQTHPIVETCTNETDIQSPSKKTKHNHETIPGVSHLDFPTDNIKWPLQKTIERPSNLIKSPQKTGEPSKLKMSPHKTLGEPSKPTRSPQKSIGESSKQKRSPHKSLGEPSKLTRSPQKSIGESSKLTRSPQKSLGEPSKPKRSPQKTGEPSKLKRSPQKCLRETSTLNRSPQKTGKNRTKSSNTNCSEETIDINKENDIYLETNAPVVRDIDCLEEDWVFQKREKAKVHSCRVPLHIAFHNYVSSRSGLRDAILRYEPVNIDDIHKGLVACGHRYDPKDLLKFMDKKCITVKTAESTKNNRKHY